MMMRKLKIGGTAVSLAALVAMSVPAAATDGYFAHGFGARHKALGGAGVADGRDSTSAALNPAGLVHLERGEFTFAVSGFSPHREYSVVPGAGGATVAPFAAAATVESGKDWFAIPNMAYAVRTHDNPYFDVFAFSVVGNGGMNTSYQPVNGLGVFSQPPGLITGRTGVNLEQALISASFAKKFGNLSVGISPTVARQQFRAAGLQGFGVADRGNDVSWGAGLRGGIEWAVMPNVRLGLAGSTPMWMQRFDKYAGLFAEQGDFDIPASLQLGIAVDVMPRLTLMADYKRIWYSQIKAINNPSTNIFGCPAFGGANPSNCLGGDNGAGFGWEDVDVIKLGLEWRATDSMTLRAGYSYNTQPIQSRDVTFNILAPGVVQNHFTAGGEVKINDQWSLELAGMYAPETSVSGPDLFVPGARETIRMYQYEVTAGIKYKFGHEDHHEDDTHK